MMRLHGLLGGCLTVALVGCGDDGGTTATAGQTDGTGGTTGTTRTSESATTTTGVSVGDSDGSDAGTLSQGMTSQPTTGPDATTTDATTDTDATAGVVSETATTADTTVDTSGTTTGETTADETTADASSTTSDCVPVEETCNKLDDDCDGIVDDIDLGGDGICDCLNIALLGNEGANPSAEFQTWLEDQGTEVDRIGLDVLTPLTKATLDKYDIVILDWLVRTYTPEEAALVDAWVKEGGGVMSMTGHTNNNTVVERPNSILGPMGLAYNASQGFFSGPVVNFTPHPITDGLTSVSFYGGLYVDITEDGVGVNETIATLAQGPVGVTQVRALGKLFVWGDEWVEFDSEWKNIPQIQQFWVNTLAWLSPKDFCVVPQ